MKSLSEILETINKCNEDYRTLQLRDTYTQSNLLRLLSCCYIDLTNHKTKAREQWLNVYNACEGSNASKEREADTEVMEFDLIKDVLKAVDNQMNSIRSTLSANKI